MNKTTGRGNDGYKFFAWAMVFCLWGGLWGAPRLEAQSYRDKYMELLRAQQYEELQRLLQRWEREEPKNPEVYVAYFNYHFNRGRRTVQTMGQGPDGRYQMYDKREYDPEHAKAALAAIDKALSLAPNRLDIYFGKTRLLSELKDYRAQKDSIVAILNRGKTINNQWLWSQGIPLQEGEQSMLSGISDYIDEWFGNFTETRVHVKELAELLTTLYPKETWSWNVLAGYYREAGDLKNAVTYLQKAESIDSQDPVIIANIGQCYLQMEEPKKALSYFKKLENHPNPNIRQYALGWIQKIEKR